MPITVKQLIARLEKFPPHLLVAVHRTTLLYESGEYKCSGPSYLLGHFEPIWSAERDSPDNTRELMTVPQTDEPCANTLLIN